MHLAAKCKGDMPSLCHTSNWQGGTTLDTTDELSDNR